MDIRHELQSLARRIKKFDDFDLHKKLMEVQAEILMLQEENKNLLEENVRLKNEISQLQEKLKIMHDIRLENSVYWLPDSQGEKGGPYCPNCWNTRQVLVRMARDTVRSRIYNKCPECMLVIMTKE